MNLITKLISNTCLVLLTVQPGFSSTVLASELGTELPNEQRLKVSRQKARNMQSIDLEDYIEAADKRDDMYSENNGDCGNVAIGNVTNNSIGSRPQQVDVIVTEDIINLAEDC